MNAAKFSSMLSRLRVADAHLVTVQDEADPGPVETHTIAARGHLAELERELTALRDALIGSPARPAPIVVAFPGGRAPRLPTGAVIAEVVSA